MVPSPAAVGARSRLLDAAVKLVRERGYAATAVDDLCRDAGVTKGAFFHHFRSKQDLAVAAADHWSRTTGEMFAAAPYHDPADPFDRVVAYLDFRAGLIRGGPAQFSCLAGTLTQETFLSHPAIREACFGSIAGHAATLEADFAMALAAAPWIGPEVTARGLALHTQVVLQGGFILAKAQDDPAPVVDGITHLKRYLQLLFHRPASQEILP